MSDQPAVRGEAVAMTAELAAQLREPFAPGAIGKLPRVTCRACGDAPRAKGHCDEHQRRRCAECGANITTAHIHLDYVGHAATTERLLRVDPWWSWEPFALDAAGLPMIDKSGGLWIRMTVAGVTRIGYGDQANGKGVKEVIGDAIRNAAMRFGVAIDLWHKGDLHAAAEHQDANGASSDTGGPAAPAAASGKGTGRQGGQQRQRGSDRPQTISQAQAGHLIGHAVKAGLTGEDGAVDMHRLHRILEIGYGVVHVRDLPRALLDNAKASVTKYVENEAEASAYIEGRYQHDRDQGGLPTLIHHTPDATREQLQLADKVAG